TRDVVELRFPGARPGVRPEGTERLPGNANFFLGDNPDDWRTDVPTYGAVRYLDLYPGIDLVYRGPRRLLKREWVIAPGSDPSPTRLAFGGDAVSLRLEADGSLRLKTAWGELLEGPPETSQEIGGQRVPVESRYVLLDEGNGPVVSFAIGGYDP